MGDRQRIALACDECNARNYKTTKPARKPGKGQTKRLAYKKFCPSCNRHTIHRESK